ncbi:MAG TPA: hypothetical protein VMD91_08615 [Candidatus Sulfotelmatobacter sp.]|nr:hypothetical protein [Candidatus Sulfotelmatobacter sp.]
MLRPVFSTAVLTVGCLLALSLVGNVRGADPPHVAASDPLTAGRFLVAYGGCNDCHTARWDQLHDATPTAELLTGNPRGFAGPWGTSYAANLRLLFAKMSPDDWLHLVRHHDGFDHPPMPWYNIQQLTPDDQRAIYVYIHGLGPAGVPAPPYTPPTAR